MPDLPIAITGVGAVSSHGIGWTALAQALLEGRDGLTLAPDDALPLSRQLPLARVQGALPCGPRSAGLAMTAMTEALRQSGLATAALGLALGSCTGGMREGEAVYLAQGPEVRPALYRDQPIGRIAIRLASALGIGGPMSAHAEACASTAGAIAEACLWLRAGLVPAVVVVGADALTRVTTGGFTALQVTDPAGCRPFAIDRAGMSLGEGAVALVLEDPAHARRRGATVLASLLGWGLTADGHHGTAPDPAGTHLEAAIRQALDDAGLDVRELGYAAAHGTGTRDNDACEARVLSRLAGAIPTASTKRCTGHTMGAAAGFSMAAAMLAVSGPLPPNAGGHGPFVDGIEVVTSRRDRSCAAALVTCLGFGGVNAALVVGGRDRCA